MTGFYGAATFWLTVPQLVVGVIGVIATYRASIPRRRLLYGMPFVTQTPNGFVVLVMLASRGRNDIPSDKFDGGQPIRLDLGVPILGILDVSTYSTPATPQPYVRHWGTSLEIWPVLLRRRHVVEIRVWTVDQPHDVTCTSSLIDVKTDPTSTNSFSVLADTPSELYHILHDVVGIVLLFGGVNLFNYLLQPTYDLRSILFTVVLYGVLALVFLPFWAWRRRRKGFRAIPELRSAPR